MLNLIFNSCNAKENFVVQEAVHKSLVGFKPYIDSDIGIVNDGNPNSFTLSIGEENDNDANVEVASPYLSKQLDVMPLCCDRITIMSFDLYTQTILCNAKEHDAFYVSGSGTVVDKNKGKIYIVLHIFPELLKEASIEDIYNVFPPSSTGMDDPRFPCGCYLEKPDLWIKEEDKNHYSSSCMKQCDMIALYSTGLTPLTFDKAKYLDKEIEYIKAINTQLIHFLYKLEMAKLI